MIRDLVWVAVLLTMACIVERPASESAEAISVDQATCVGVFEGHYEKAFELSRFAPCDGSVHLADGRRLKVPSAWVYFRGDALERIGVLAPSKGSEVPVSHARFHGTLRGPGCYGHMGLASFELVVDRIDELEATQQLLCSYTTLSSELERRLVEGPPYPCEPTDKVTR